MQFPVYPVFIAYFMFLRPNMIAFYLYQQRTEPAFRFELICIILSLHTYLVLWYFYYCLGQIKTYLGEVNPKTARKGPWGKDPHF